MGDCLGTASVVGFPFWFGLFYLLCLAFKFVFCLFVCFLVLFLRGQVEKTNAIKVFPIYMYVYACISTPSGLIVNQLVYVQSITIMLATCSVCLLRIYSSKHMYMVFKHQHFYTSVVDTRVSFHQRLPAQWQHHQLLGRLQGGGL